MAYDPLFIQYLHYFNVKRDYFECHEVMEELWLEEGRDPLCQGLLQAAVGLYHARNDNVSGAIKMFNQAIEKLSHYPGAILGINLAKLIEDCEHYKEKLRDNERTPFPFVDLTIEIIDPWLADQVLKEVEQKFD